MHKRKDMLALWYGNNNNNNNNNNNKMLQNIMHAITNESQLYSAK